MTRIITICCSANFYKQALEIEEQLKALGFKVLIPSTAYKMKDNNDFNPASYKTWFKNKADYKVKTKLMDDHFKKVLESDAILVLNGEKNGIKGYIGGNTLMEMTLAYHYKKPIYVYNEISPELPIAEEIYGLNPIFINGNLKILQKDS